MNIKKIISCIVCPMFIAFTGCQRELTASTIFEVRGPSQSIAENIVRKTFVPDAPTMTLETKGRLFLIGVEDSDPKRAVYRVNRALKIMNDAIEKENTDVMVFVVEEAKAGGACSF